MHNCSRYLRMAFDPKHRSNTITKAIKTLESVKFDAVVCKGVSGLAIAPTIADAFGVSLCVVRHKKAKDHSHCEKLVEGPENITRFIIIDDFVCTGATVCQIFQAMRQEYPEALYRKKDSFSISKMRNRVYQTKKHYL